jgi:AcrR family transcriptional regulator
MSAVVECCALLGYEAMSVEDIIMRAGVSRRTFYVNFRSKADAFIRAYREMAERLLDAAERASRRHDPSPEAVIAGMRAYLETLEAQPPLARACLIDIITSGADGLRERNEVHRRFADVLRGSIPADEFAEEEPVALLAELVIGGVYELVSTRVLEQGAEDLVSLLPDLAYVAVAPFFGHDVARAHRDSLRERSR